MKRSLTTICLLVGSLVSCETPQALYEEARVLYEKKDYTAALPLLKQCAEDGHAEAQLMLGRCYDFGYVQKDLPEAVRWYKAAAEADNVEAQNNLAAGYFSGAGVPVDMTAAAYWYGRAAEQGSPSAYNNLGLHYLNGQGVTKDDEQAAECFAMAAKLNDANGQYNLGKCYYFGIGVPEDLNMAKSWISKAAEQGHRNAALFKRDNDWK